PMGMSVEYRKPAKTNLRAIASLDPLPQFGQEKANVDIPVSIRDTSDAEVCKAVITIRVTPRS
ncbi:MAG: DUF4442 domain-containing protein, partial [Thermoleophilaceae bacterium]|nr:DUF4442 domain-containing protein [Thermoleophilaceae bacterium]